MGIQLTQLVEGQGISLEELFDQRVAIDAYNWIYQFLSIIRQPDGEPLKDSSGRVTSHLSGLYYRTLKLMEAGLHPIYVFDGEPPAFKKETTEKRRDIREEAAKEWKEALEKKDYERARKAAQRSVTITDEIVEGSKKLLEAMGLPVIQAPGEGEALAAVMCSKGHVHSVATQDYDTLLFGAPQLVRNLSITGKKKRGDSYIEIKPELLVLKDVLKSIDVTREQLIIIGILIGTDYNPGGIQGFGPKKALEIVKEKKTLDNVLEGLAWDHAAQPEEIYDFFLKPQEAEYDIKFSEPSEEKIKKLLCDEHDFSEERIGNALKKLTEKKGSQSSLGRWVK